MSGLPKPPTDNEWNATSRKMLILDDDAGVSRTVAQMAKSLGVQVQACATLAEFEAALPIFRPDILLIDLMMPEIDGIEAIGRIRPLCDAPIYVMSGADKRTYEASREVLRLSNVPIAGFLEKPFSLAQLRATLMQSQETVVPSEPIAARETAERLSPSMFADLAGRGKVVPFFQPIIDARTRSLKGFEALLRVEGQCESRLPSEYFDHLANNDVLSMLVTDVVIERSLRFLADIGAKSDVSLSINVFGTQAVADGFRECLAEKCLAFGIAPSRIILELSEATICDFDETEMRKMTQLRLAGFGLSIDDFGTRHSSLGRLASLPFSELKIDKSFCLALPESHSAEAIIEACISIARKLEMNVTAEGIESSEIADIVTRMGCDALQGHYFGQAMPIQEAIQWVDHGCPFPGKRSHSG